MNLDLSLNINYLLPVYCFVLIRLENVNTLKEKESIKALALCAEPSLSPFCAIRQILKYRF